MRMLHTDQDNVLENPACYDCYHCQADEGFRNWFCDLQSCNFETDEEFLAKSRKKSRKRKRDAYEAF